MKELEYRMYFFVPYNISEIQKGIQAGHAALEYAYLYGDTEEYVQFIEKNKTWIILNGGTTNMDNGSLNSIMDELHKNEIPFAEFYEPDLNDALTAVCFLVPNTVYENLSYDEWYDDSTIDHSISYEEYIGGEKNQFLKELITGKKLA